MIPCADHGWRQSNRNPKNRQMTSNLKKFGGATLSRLKKHGVLILALVGVFFLLSAKPAGAFVISWLIYATSWFISMLAAIAIAVEAWILGFILKINTEILDSPVVIVGFPVSLSIANLFFVLAIIIIAIATILRLQTYGLKQTLWKLVVMAIGVNFGLIIAGMILQFSDSLSFYFINTAADPTSGENSVTQFASAIAGAFQPQQIALLGASVEKKPNDEGVIKNFWNKIKGTFELLKSASAGDIGAVIGAELLEPLAGLVFTIFFLIFMVIVLAVLIVQFVLRYVYLGFLLVVLPLAWASWIFPLTHDNWTKWWRNFIKWTFFAPLVLFFMWIAIQTSYALNTLNVHHISEQQAPTNSIWQGIENFFSGLFKETFKKFLQLTVVLSVMLFGMFAAQSMGIKLADVVTGAATGAAARFGKWTGRKGVQFGTAPLRTEGMQKIAARLQTGKLSRIPGASYVGGAMEKLATAGGDRAVKEASKRLEGMTDEQVAHGMSRFDAPTRWAALQQLQKNGKLGLLGEDIDRYLGQNKETEAKRYGQDLLFKQMRTESGLELRDLIRKREAARGRPEEAVAQQELTSHLRSLTKTGQLAKILVSEDRLAKERPLNMDVDEVKRFQEFLFKAVVEDFSGSNITDFVKEAVRSDQLDALKAAGQRAVANGITSPNQMSRTFRRWIKSSAARGLVDETIFGL